MASGTNIATAWVQLAVSADGFADEVRRKVGEQGFDDAGSKAGDGFMGGFGRALGGIGKIAAASIAAVGVAVGGALVKGISAFTDFERGMNEVFSLIPDAGQQTFDKMTKQVKDFSKEFGVLPEKVIPGLYDALSSGVPQDNVFAFLETAQKAARGGATELGVTVDGLTSVINAYGSANIDAGTASDVMFQAVKLGKTTFEELSRSLFNVNPAAAAVGIKFQEVSGALAAMTAQGVPTSVATTQIRSAIVELTQGAGKASKAFVEIAGKSFPDFIKGGGTMQEAFNLLRQGADDTGSSVLDMFGSVEGGQAVLALTGQNADAFATAMDAMNNASGATDQAFQQLSKGLGPVFDRIKAGAQVFLIDLGEKAAPYVMKALDLMGAAFSKLQEIAGPIFNTIKLGVAALISAFQNPDVTSDGFVGLMEKIGVGARKVIDVLRNIDWGAVFSKAKAFIEPVVEAVLNLAGSIGNFLVVSFQTVKKLIEDNRETLKSLGEKLLEVGGFIKDTLASAINGIAGTFDFLSRNMEAVKLVAVPLIAAFATYKTIMTGVSVVTNAVTLATKAWSIAQLALNVAMSLNPIGLIIAAIAALVAGVIYAYTHFEGFRNVVDKVGDAFQFVFNWVKDNWPTILAILAGPVGIAVLLIVKHWDTLKDAVLGVVDFVGDKLEAFVRFFAELPGKIVNAVGDFASLLLEKGKDLIRGIVSGVSSFIGNLLNDIGQIGYKVLVAIGNAELWLFDKGAAIIRGIINGIYSYYSNLISFFLNLGSNVVGWIADAGSWLYDAGADLIRGLINGIKSMASNAAEAAKNVAKAAVDGVKNFLGIGSPSKLFHQFGVWTIQGYIDGLEKMYPKVDVSLSRFASDLSLSTSAAFPPPIATAPAAFASAPAVGPSTGLGGGVVVNANTNADPFEIAQEIGWVTRTAGV